MRLANEDGRAVIVTSADGALRGVDVARASNGRFGPELAAVFEDWTAFRAVADDLVRSGPPQTLDEASLGPPSPAPRQVFGIGINYKSHAEETGAVLPAKPATFTKFPTSLTGPFATVVLPEGTVDWEVELVFVIGARAERVVADDAWDHIAGVTIGQDLSERGLQFAAGAQFSLGKSYPGFAPTGPWLVTPDELPSPDDLGPGLLRRRRDRAGRPHVRPHLRRPASGRGALAGAAPAPRRRLLHRHAVGGGRVAPPPAVPAAGRGPRELDRGDRHDAHQPHRCRLTRPPPLWAPSAARVEASTLRRFADVASHLHELDDFRYDAVHRWSVERPDEFWSTVWHFAGVVGDAGERVVDPAPELWRTRYFPDARLNFAENLLRRHDDTPALLFAREDGARRTLTWAELHALVARVQRGAARRRRDGR